MATIGRKDLAIFTREFATLITAGVSILQSLDHLAARCEKRVLGAVLRKVHMDLGAGSTLTGALKKHPYVFDDLYVNLVQAGEVGGRLDDTLQRLAERLERAVRLRARIKTAMIYPAVIVTVAVIVFAIFTPIITIVSFWWVLGAVAALFALTQYSKTPGGRLTLDAAVLALPRVGDLIRKIAMTRFAWTLGALLESGVPIMDALEITARNAGNKVVERAIMEVRQSVGEGKTLSEPIEKSGVFPPMAVEMISSGETAGELSSMLSKIADIYEQEVETAVSVLISLLPPILLIIVAIYVGYSLVRFWGGYYSGEP